MAIEDFRPLPYDSRARWWVEPYIALLNTMVSYREGDLDLEDVTAINARTKTEYELSNEAFPTMLKAVKVDARDLRCLELTNEREYYD